MHQPRDDGADGSPDEIPDDVTRAVARETSAYGTLIDDSGRPSHPLHLMHSICKGPGAYRGILNCWQDYPDQWQVYTKQYKWWMKFRHFQREARKYPRSEGSSYADEVRKTFEKSGIQATRALNDSFWQLFDGHPGGLDHLSTWIECLHYVYMYYVYEWDVFRISGRDKACREALARLVDSGVLQVHEMNESAVLGLCNLSAVERAQLKCDIYKYAKAGDKAKVQQLEKRNSCISLFEKEIEPSLKARAQRERYRLLGAWVEEQVRLIAAEEEKRPRGFQRLPPEIRQIIWLMCLQPPGPTVNYFDVLNSKPPLLHLAHYWSSQEFRVRATRHRDSAYLAIYTLLATCRESRFIAARYCLDARLAANKRLGLADHAAATEPPDGGFGNFETFDWIPADDLVVLCFPPKQVAALPQANAISFAHGPPRFVRVLLSPGLINADWSESTEQNLRNGSLPMSQCDPAQTHVIGEIIASLRGGGRRNGTKTTGLAGEGGFRRLHFVIEGLYSWFWDPHTVIWTFEMSRRAETCIPWSHFWSPNSGRLEDAPGRHFWRLVSCEKNNGGLAELLGSDQFERSPGRNLLRVLRETKLRECEEGSTMEPTIVVGTLKI